MGECIDLGEGDCKSDCESKSRPRYRSRYGMSVGMDGDNGVNIFFSSCIDIFSYHLHSLV